MCCSRIVTSGIAVPNIPLDASVIATICMMTVPRSCAVPRPKMAEKIKAKPRGKPKFQKRACRSRKFIAMLTCVLRQRACNSTISLNIACSVRENPCGFGFTDPGGKAVFQASWRRNVVTTWWSLARSRRRGKQPGIGLVTTLRRHAVTQLETSCFPAVGKGRSDATLTNRTALWTERFGPWKPR